MVDELMKVRLPVEEWLKMETPDPLAPEAVAAAKWWADVLRHPRMPDAGPGPKAELLAIRMAASSREAFAADSVCVETFERVLALIVQKRFVNGDNWDTRNPRFGCALRILCTDWSACNELKAAYQWAGGDITAHPFPIKTCMWISPGSVRVRLGVSGGELELLL